MSLLGGVLEELGVVVLEKSAENFVLHSDDYIWFSRLLEGINHGQIIKGGVIQQQHLSSAFPFIENFLFDAEKIWNDAQQPSQRSGIWTEVDARGNAFQLEARACVLQGKSILLVENHSPMFVEHQAVYQKARDIALMNEKLVLELNQRQRELQDEIEQRILQGTSVRGIAEAVKNHTSAVMICQPDGKIEVMNSALIDIYQVSDQEEFERVSLLDQWMTEADEQYPELKRVIAKGAYWEGEFESRSSGGQSRWIHLTIGTVKTTRGAVSHYVCVANDISEFRNLDSSIGGDGGFDMTTHLPNRRHFWRHINGFLEEPMQEGQGLGLVYIDLDYFKRVNDDLGHQAGDFLLSAIASRIARSVKHDDFVAHLGGDEFAVLASTISSEAELLSLAERLLLAIQEPVLVEGKSISVSASIGISVCFDGALEPAQLVRQADLAMYSAKRLGKAQVMLYEPALVRNTSHTLLREHELIDAIDRQEFTLFLQPLVSVGKPHKMRAEALIRWQHPKHGLLAPAEFISIAEDAGLIIPIGTWVLKSACLMGAELIRQNKAISVAVNISAKQLRHPDFYQTLVSALEETRYPAKFLELEITESCFLDDLEAVIKLIEKIQKLGVNFSLDDFGTGFSSLNYLRQLPVDYLKIDKSFVQELSYDPHSQAIIRFVIRLAHELNIEVIAEGVETEEQLKFLLDQQVNFIQGYLFHKPMPLEELMQGFAEIKHTLNRSSDK